jgi:hypothetical protein
MISTTSYMSSEWSDLIANESTRRYLFRSSDLLIDSRKTVSDCRLKAERGRTCGINGAGALQAVEAGLERVQRPVPEGAYNHLEVEQQRRHFHQLQKAEQILFGKLYIWLGPWLAVVHWASIGKTTSETK